MSTWILYPVLRAVRGSHVRGSYREQSVLSSSGLCDIISCLGQTDNCRIFYFAFFAYSAILFVFEYFFGFFWFFSVFLVFGFVLFCPFFLHCPPDGTLNHLDVPTYGRRLRPSVVRQSVVRQGVVASVVAGSGGLQLAH